ncbi:MAG: UDP-N-acetylmuramoyl-L-alanine--D-glutamate ligase [Gemmatimonadota bacterium]
MGASVSIIGLGASGISAARLALTKGETVYVSDVSTNPRVAARGRELELLGAEVQLGSHDLDRIQASRLVVVSPGIAPDTPVLAALRSRGVRWISEPEFAVRFYSGSLIAITGTNGKTTTSSLTAHLLESSGITAALGGNVGGSLAPPASDLALLDPPPAWYVLEMSSFQLADTLSFAPEIGVVTNLAPDHLDRYPDTTTYFADKALLFRNAKESSLWVLNGDDPATLALPGSAAGVRHLFTWASPGNERAGTNGSRGKPSPSAYVRDGVLTLAVGGSRGEEGGDEAPLLPRGELQLLGRHNVMNALAASLAARLAGADPEGIRKGLRSFRPLPHRLEPVLDGGGVLWVNDSKATNVAASLSAIRSMERPLVLLLGGKDKGEDFRPLGRALSGKSRAVVMYGAAAARLGRELAEALGEKEASSSRKAPVLLHVAGGLEEAVALAGSVTEAGDAVLLAPACSSFDEFEGYEARGRRFAELASLLGSSREGGER